MGKNKKQIQNEDSIFNDGGINLHISQSRLSFLSCFGNLRIKWRVIKNFKFIRIIRGFLSLLLLIAIICQINFTFLENKTMWRTNIYKIQIGGQSSDIIRKRLDNIFSNYLSRKMTFTVGSNFYGIQVRNLGISFDTETLLNNIFTKGHTKDFISDFMTRNTSPFIRNTYPIAIKIDTDILRNTLERLIPELENTPQDAKVIINEGVFTIKHAQDGVTTDYNKLADILISNAKRLTLSPIKLNIVEATPAISDSKAKIALEQAQKYINKKVSLKADILNKNFDFDIKEYIDFIRFSKLIDPISKAKILIADLDPKKIQQYLKENISPQIHTERHDTKIRINDNLDFSADGIIQDGYTLDIVSTTEKIRNNFNLEDYNNEIPLNIIIYKGQILQPKEINSGIKEIIAIGESTFKGSPNSRKHNIETAMKRFQNVIILPGQVFSFDNQLGPVNDKTGYKKELVIKEGGKTTIAEYGGGICQVSTTLFRAALNAGFPIIERRSHSYKVVYYNPDGLDATIYPPNVDLKFKNDTLFPILIQNKLDQENGIARFFIYGTNDGRKIELDGPHRYAFQRRPDKPITEYVPSKPKTWKRSKRGHNGFKTYWIRTITKIDEEPKEEYFYSVYKAIPDKLQIGGNAPEQPSTY